MFEKSRCQGSKNRHFGSGSPNPFTRKGNQIAAAAPLFTVLSYLLPCVRQLHGQGNERKIKCLRVNCQREIFSRKQSHRRVQSARVSYFACYLISLQAKLSTNQPIHQSTQPLISLSSKVSSYQGTPGSSAKAH